MLYGYDICPTCKDRLIKRIQEKGTECFEQYAGKCEKCGDRLRLAFTGEREIDDTIYKIELSPRMILDKDSVKAIMRICGCEKEAAREILEREEDILLEGDAFHTYLNMELLDECNAVYYVYPEFPFARRAYVICPDCGNELLYKTEETDVKENDTDYYVQAGFFCERCNQWVAATYRRRIDVDETKYRLEICLEKLEVEEGKIIRKMVDELSDKRTLLDKIIACDTAFNIHPLLEELKEKCIDYTIEPPYPHRIAEYKKEWTEEDLQILMEMNPGLTVNLEEMNGLK